MMFIVKYKENSTELLYILDILLKEFLGFNYQFKKENIEQIEISRNDSASLLSLNSDFFEQSKGNWLSKESLPKMPLKHWHKADNDLNVTLTESSFPVIYGTPKIDIEENQIHCGIDLLGSTFFMLSRYEEAINNKRDQYDRFPASASLAYQEGFLDRPIVNEYLEILWGCLKKLWPSLKRKQHQFQMKISCDVDHPYQCGTKQPIKQIKRIAGDLLVRKSPVLAIKSLINYFAVKFGSYYFDPNYQSLNWIMDVNEAAGNKVVFFFIAGHTNKELDGCYSLEEPIVQKLMKNIHKRGHEIGLHPSYGTYKNSSLLQKEFENLRGTIEKLNIKQKYIGSRQHYLRWNSSITAKNLNDVGMDYDSTLIHGDHVGFRCGVCYEYRLYDLYDRNTLDIVERPLIIMEGTMIDKTEMNLGKTELTKNYLERILNVVKSYNGNFELLWHNTRLISKWDRRLYEGVINEK